MADDTKLLAVIEANTRSFENALKRIEGQTERTFVRADRSVKRLDTSLKSSAASAARFGRSLGIAFSGAAAIALASRTIRAFIDNTIESEAVIAQLNAVLKSTGGAVGLTSDQLQELAKQLQSVSVFGDEAILGAENILLTFNKIGKDVFPGAIEAVLNMSTALGTDLTSSARIVGRAFQDPIKGLTALTRAGIQFTEAEKKIIENLTKTGKLAEAHTILLDKLATKYGESARAARDTLGGALKALSEAWGDLFEVSGPASDALRLAIEQLITSISDPQLKEAVAIIGTDLLNALKGIIELAPQFSERLRSIHQDFADFSASVSNAKQDFEEFFSRIGRKTGTAQLSNWLGFGDHIASEIDKAHDAISRAAPDFELLDALEKKFSIAPSSPTTAGGGVGFVDPDALADETAALDAEAAAIEAAQEAAREAERERKQAADQIIRQKEAVRELISDLEFENSLIGLSNEQREIEIALRRAGAVATTEQRAEIAGLVAAGLQEQAALDAMIVKMDELRSIAGGALSSFTDSLREGEGLAGGLKSALDSVLDSVIRIAQQKMIESLFGAFGTAGAGFGGSFSGGPSVAPPINPGLNLRSPPGGLDFSASNVVALRQGVRGAMQPSAVGAVNVTNHYDFRGADKSAVPDLKRLAEMQRRQMKDELPAMLRQHRSDRRLRG